MNDGLDELWRGALRSLRSQRPPLAARGARASTFGAALEQAEQLWSASSQVGPAASPILLFYGLNQAGRAICAGRFRGASWRPPESHGLSFTVTSPREDRVLSLTDVEVSPDGRGLVQHVAASLDSPVLATSATLAELLAALDLALFFEDDDLPGARPLEVYEDGFTQWTPGQPVKKSLLIGPLPEELAERIEHVPAGPRHMAYTRRLPPSKAEVATWLAPYARLASIGPPDTIGDPEPADHFLRRGRWAIRFSWDGTPAETTQHEWTINQLDLVHSRGWGDSGGVVYPAIGGNAAPQKQLITWWLVLYALSMLARYQPREWVAMLNVDRSRLAVPLEQLLSKATSELLELVVEALDPPE